MDCFFCNYNPGQNVLGHLSGKLGTKTHFAKLTHILPLKKAWGCCYKGLFLLSPSPPSSVDGVELKLECITSTLHRGGRGEGRCLNLRSYCVSVPRVLTRVEVKKKKGITFPLPFLKTSRKKLLAINLPTDAPFLLEGHCALLLFYLPFIMIVFQVQNVHL